jgi:FMN-dependent NADH-azoreductase
MAARRPVIEAVRRGLAACPPDHLTSELFAAEKLDKGDGLSERQKRERELTDALVEELLSADAIVIGALMYNFSIPTQLKAWIDRIAQAGRTFRYTDKGPIGLAAGRRS